MKPSKLYEALHALIGERVPLHIWGPCGIGKSQIVGQVASDLDYEFLDVRAVQLDPVDLRGLPRICSDQTEWVPPKFLPIIREGHPLSRRAHFRAADDAGRMLSAGAGPPAGRVLPARWVGRHGRRQSGIGTRGSLCHAAAFAKQVCASRS